MKIQYNKFSYLKVRKLLSDSVSVKMFVGWEIVVSFFFTLKNETFFYEFQNK